MDKSTARITGGRHKIIGDNQRNRIKGDTMTKPFEINTGDLANIMMGGGSTKDHGKQSKESHNAQNNRGKYVGAPYNFVPFTNNVFWYEQGKQTSHNDVSDELLSGEITYKIRAETQIIVDDGSGHFCKNAYGKYAIPGSSIRGLIRNNVQILGLSSVKEDIDSYALMYRNVASGPKKEKERYAEVLGVDNNDAETRGIARNVKAGYLILKSGKYYINGVKRSFEKDTNYLMLSSRYILAHPEDFPFFMQDWKHHMMYRNDCKFERRETINGTYDGKKAKFIIKTEDKEKVDQSIRNEKFSFVASKIYPYKGNIVVEIQEIGKPGIYDMQGQANYKNKNMGLDRIISYEPKYKWMVNEDYAPYYEPIFYQLDKEQKRVVSVYARDCKVDSCPPGMQKGYVLSSGRMNNKKNIYIIPEEETNIEQAIKISKEDIRAFSADLQKRKTTLRQYFKSKGKSREDMEKEALAFFGLPQGDGDRKPVFYIEDRGKLYFGFTPRLRLFYDYEISQGINKEHKEGILDYSKAIFGYSGQKESYKSKVSFSDAVAESGKESKEWKNPILRSPKPTSYLDYLVQGKNNSNQAVTYNDSNMQLRGVKQYWIHDEIARDEMARRTIDDDEKEGFYPLEEKTEFRGKIRFWNMTEDELGLLLWSIQLDPEKSWMNIGKAKPYGYGSISVKLTSVKKLDKQKAYSLERLELDPLTDIDVAEMIRVYKERMNQFLGKDKIDEFPGIKDFFDMKDHNKVPENSTIKYMSIDNREYQNRKNPLPSIKETIKNNSKS